MRERGQVRDQVGDLKPALFFRYGGGLHALHIEPDDIFRLSVRFDQHVLGGHVTILVDRGFLPEQNDVFGDPQNEDRKDERKNEKQKDRRRADPSKRALARVLNGAASVVLLPVLALDLV